MRKVDTVVVGKTGTLTEGKPKLVSVNPAPAFEEERVLQLAANLERCSEHPLAAAIFQGTEARGIHLSSGDAFESVPGKGARAWVNGTSVALGNRYMMDDAQVNVGVLSVGMMVFSGGMMAQMGGMMTAGMMTVSILWRLLLAVALIFLIFLLARGSGHPHTGSDAVRPGMRSLRT